MKDSLKNDACVPNAKWDSRFIKLAETIASWSEDTSRKVGAVVVGGSHEIRSTGYNGLPRGVKADVPERHSRAGEEKYHWYEHAERNAIYNAARVGIPLEGCTIYTNLFPCSDCARAIVQSGLKVLKTNQPPTSDAKYERSFEVSKEILEEGGVKVLFVNLP